MLWDRGMPGIPQENTPKGERREHIKAHYVMKVLRSIKGEMIDATHPDFGREQNIGLHDIVSQGSMNRIEKNGQIMVGGKTLQGRVDYGYCPLCPYASQNHLMLNNHIWLHFHVSMVCRMADCWYVSHNADDMWKHAAGLPLNPSPSMSRRSDTGQYPYLFPPVPVYKTGNTPVPVYKTGNTPAPPESLIPDGSMYGIKLKKFYRIVCCFCCLLLANNAISDLLVKHSSTGQLN